MRTEKKQPIGVYRPDHSGRFSGLWIALAVHAVVAVALFQYRPTRGVLTNGVPIMVNFIAPPPVVEKPRQPPKPLPMRRKPEPPLAPPPPVMTAAAEAPAPHVVPVPPPVPAPASPAPIAPVAPPAAAAPALPSPPIVQPSYNADYLQNPAPRYPPLARRMGQQGRVVLRVLVAPGGTPSQVEVRSSSGSELLDAAALEAVRRWRFVPARQGNEPVAAWVLVPITFSLQG